MTRYAPDGGITQKPWILWVAGGGWGLRDERVLYDPTNLAGPPWWGGSIYASEDYVVFAVHVASNSHNGQTLAGLTGNTAWVVGAMLEMDQLVTYDKANYVVLQPHEADALYTPGEPAALRYFELIDANDNDPALARRANRGETQPAYGNQAIADIHRAHAFIVRNALALGVDPAKSVWAGDSSGGFDVARAAAVGPMPAVAAVAPGSVHEFNPIAKTVPAALLIGIAPTYIDQYVTVDLGEDQAFMRGFFPSIYGRPELFNYADWSVFPTELKQSVDPVRLMERTGYSYPTYLYYGEGPNHTEETDAQTFNGYVGVGPNYHGSNNGWRFLERLTRPADSGGQGRTDCVFLENGVDADTLQRWTIHTDHGGSGTPSNVSPATAEGKRDQVAADQVAWLANVLGL